MKKNYALIHKSNYFLTKLLLGVNFTFKKSFVFLYCCRGVCGKDLTPKTF